MDNLLAISPIDGRYNNITNKLSKYFSEFALIKYRIKIEIEYFLYLHEILDKPLSIDCLDFLKNYDVSIEDAKQVKEIELTTKHDIKAVEYFLKEKLRKECLALNSNIELIHFGLTSQDINSVALSLSLMNFTQYYFEELSSLLYDLTYLTTKCKDTCLSFTHGQPASPTSLCKELMVFYNRLYNQKIKLLNYSYSAKFGGAVGNLNAHYAAYPEIDWHGKFNQFLKDKFGLTRNHPTTQIDYYDNIIELLQIYQRINTILIDLSQDMWLYISKKYFKQKVIESEVGSSTMPHKVNPINFENAEGNLYISNGLIDIFTRKLPVSRLQRDLTDSTIVRNIGVALSHSCIALHSLALGLGKVEADGEFIKKDLEDNATVLSEGIQTILKRYGYADAYEKIKEVTRGKEVTMEALHEFINGLDIDSIVKDKLLDLNVFNYKGTS